MGDPGPGVPPSAPSGVRCRDTRSTARSLPPPDNNTHRPARARTPLRAPRRLKERRGAETGDPLGLTWGGGARSWQPVEGSDAEALRERRGPRVWCFGGRHAHPVGPWLSSRRRGWTLPVVSAPRWDPYHGYFRRLLRAPPCRSRRGTALSRLRGDASRTRRPVTPPTGRGGLGGGGATEILWGKRGKGPH